MISLQKIITKLKSLIDKNTADITALNNDLANISGTATPFGKYKNQSISYMRFGRIVVITGSVDVGSVQDSTGYPEGNHYAIASIPYPPLGGTASLSAYCTNASADAQVWVENTGYIVFKSTRNAFPDVIYISGAFIMA